MARTIFSTDKLRCSYTFLYGALSPNLSIPTDTPVSPKYFFHEETFPASIVTIKDSSSRIFFLKSSDCLSKSSWHGIETTLDSILFSFKAS